MTPADPGTDIESLRGAAVTDCRALLVAEDELSAQLQHHRAVTSAMMQTMGEGTSLLDTLHANHPDEIRPLLTSAIRNFERARHRARLRLIAVAIAEGASDQDVRHPWSVSHEMVRRAKRELTEIDDFGGNPSPD